MHVYNAVEIVSGIFTFEVKPLVWIKMVPCVIDGEEEGEFRGGIKEFGDLGCEDFVEVGYCGMLGHYSS